MAEPILRLLDFMGFPHIKEWLAHRPTRLLLILSVHKARSERRVATIVQKIKVKNARLRCKTLREMN